MHKVKLFSDIQNTYSKPYPFCQVFLYPHIKPVIYYVHFAFETTNSVIICIRRHQHYLLISVWDSETICSCRGIKVIVLGLGLANKLYIFGKSVELANILSDCLGNRIGYTLKPHKFLIYLVFSFLESTDFNFLCLFTQLNILIN